jgi:hypothetical protein
VAAALYALRAATIFTTDGPFAADGLLGIWVPVAAIVVWVAAAAGILARDLGRGSIAGISTG